MAEGESNLLRKLEANHLLLHHPNCIFSNNKLFRLHQCSISAMHNGDVPTLKHDIDILKKFRTLAINQPPKYTVIKKIRIPHEMFMAAVLIRIRGAQAQASS